MSNCDLTRPVGEVFTDEKGVQLQVVNSPGCRGCYYDNGTLDCQGGEIMGLCSLFSRTDGNTVIFVEVKGGQQ